MTCKRIAPSRQPSFPSVDFLSSANQRDNNSPSIMTSHDFQNQIRLGTITLKIFEILCCCPCPLCFIENNEPVDWGTAILIAILYKPVYLSNPRPN